MGLEDLLEGGGLGSIAQIVAGNPQILAAAASLLNPKDPSVGGNAGLLDLVQAFQGKGLGGLIGSWVGGGPNQAVSANQITDVLGADTLTQFAQKAGVNVGDAGGVLASVLPVLVNHITPQGQVPEAGGLESTLGGLLSMLGGGR
jgi:uncharacterized protein YidB (DUF937 family)